MTDAAADAAAGARGRLAALAKPAGSLGRLERLAERLAASQRRADPASRPARCVIFAADHGVVAAGVGVWPAAVTTAVARLILDGRSCAGALAGGTDILLVDVGLSGPPDARARAARVAPGTANLAHGPAMTGPQRDQAWAAGAAVARDAAAAGVRVLALGEIGIGNTTSAAALIAALTGQPAAALVGPGAGVTPETLAAKRAVVAEAVARSAALADGDRVAALGGFEIVALAGCIAACGTLGLTAVLDGVVVGAAALVAERLQPGAVGACIAAHRSAEPAHAGALAALGLEPFLDWELRLGEATGALLLLPLLDAAAALLTRVATLEEALGR